MSGFEFDEPVSTDAGGGPGNHVTEPGSFHFVCLGVDPNPKDKSGNYIERALFRIRLQVLDGTVSDQTGKETDVMLWKWDTDKDGGEFSRKKLFRWFDALGCIVRSDNGRAKIVIGPDVPDGHEDQDKFARGRQLVAEFELDKKRSVDGKRYVQPAFANVFHVDDPAIAGVPKDGDALSLLPASLRRSAKSFQKKDATASGGAGGQANGGQQKTAQTAQTQSAVTEPVQKPAQQAAAAATSLDDI